MKGYRINGSRRRWPKILLFAMLLAGILLLLVVFGIRELYKQNLRAVDSSASEDIVYVLKIGDGVSDVAKGLKTLELIRSEQAFEAYVRSNELAEEFKAGTYTLRKSFDVPTITTYLVEGRVDTKLFTILPGQRLDQIRQAFIDNGGYTAEQVDAALDPANYAGHAALVDRPAEASLEGYLYPDSYEKIAETTPETIISQSLNEMAEALTPDIRAGIAAQGLSVYQGITLASVVEREVSGLASESDRPQAAQVFLKRLEIGMMLQSNATDYFADNISASYDTYAVTGLPPGPISNVSTTSLQAVATPAPTNYLYFVAGCDGVTRFSSTLEEHDALKSQHGIAEVTC